MKIWYSVKNENPGMREIWMREMDINGKYDITRPIEQEEIINQCARHFFYHGPGYDEHWPLVFTLYKENHSEPIASFRAGFDMEPEFYNNRIGGE